ncbi:MAG: aminopeptidase P family protein [Clostridia bacterium]|nr:aminopeptidase P family protein [Clostridia bacterium]
MRIKEIQKILPYDTCALITSDVNRLYLSGFTSSAGSVLITKDTAILLIDFRYFEKAKKSVRNMDVRLCKSLYADIKELLKEHNIKNILIETEHICLDSFERMSNALQDFNILKDNTLSQKLNALRQIKSQDEIRLIKKAQKITDDAFSHILNFIKVGVTEREIALELEFFMRKNKSEGVAFDTIAVSGKNSSLPHGVPTDKPLENGDFLTMDFGAVYKGYRSDMTRTVALGFVTDEQTEVYNTVLKAQTEALKKIKPNAICKEIDKTARDIITAKGYGEFFGHGLGHSVGLEIHENPAFNTRDETPLQKGMVITVEPGIYLPDKFGVRIEDMVAVTDTDFENLTQSPKNLIII